jgi:hypothetical protein
MRYDDEQFPIIPTELFEIDYKGDTIKFYMVADSEKGTRAKIYAEDASGSAYNNVRYYLNGTLVDRVIVSNDEWFTLIISCLTCASKSSHKTPNNRGNKQPLHFERQLAPSSLVL